MVEEQDQFVWALAGIKPGCMSVDRGPSAFPAQGGQSADRLCLVLPPEGGLYQPVGRHAKRSGFGISRGHVG